MIVAIGCDPNARDMMQEVSDELVSLNHSVVSFGSDDPIYANTAIRVAEAVVGTEADRGIVLCGTGIGVSIAVNKVPGAYCALVTDIFQAERAALSNNANIIAIGAQVTGVTIARRIARTWITRTSEFDPEGRSGPKVARIIEYEKAHLYDSNRT